MFQPFLFFYFGLRCLVFASNPIYIDSNLHFLMCRKAFLAMSFLASIIIVLLIFPREEKPIRIPIEGEAFKQIREFNSSASAIKSISCDVVTMGSKTELVYIKPSNVLAVTSLPFGRKHAEVATDGRDYWFWIMDFDRTSIYHCPLSEISSTRVILPMRPNLITSVVGIDEIRWESMSMDEGTAQLTCFEGDLAKCVSFRDGNVVRIAYRRGELPVMTATFKSHQNIGGFEVPKEVKVFWHEENASLDFEIKNVVLNITKPPEIKMPEGLKKVSLLDY